MPRKRTIGSSTSINHLAPDSDLGESSADGPSSFLKPGSINRRIETAVPELDHLPTDEENEPGVDVEEEQEDDDDSEEGDDDDEEDPFDPSAHEEDRSESESIIDLDEPSAGSSSKVGARRISNVTRF
jgi:hypothetical protein